MLILLIMTVMGVGSTWAADWEPLNANENKWIENSITGSGTEGDPYIIDTPQKLAYLGWVCANKKAGYNKYWKLGADIDLSGNNWKYGSGQANAFQGCLDGDGKTISNLTIVPTSAKNNGLFCTLQGTAASRAEVKNLIIDGVTISHTGSLANTTITGALAGNVTEYTDIVNVTVKDVSISLANLTNTNYVGGFVGRFEKNQSTVTECSVDSPSIAVTGSISGGASYIGGAIAYMAGSNNLLSAIDDLTVTSPSVTINKVAIKDCYIGAVFGRLNTYFTCNDVNVSNPTLTYNNTDNQNVALNLGSFAGGFGGNTTKEVSVTNVMVTGIAQLTLGTEGNKETTEVKSVKAGLIGYTTSNVRLEDWTVEKTNVQVLGKLTTTGSQIGAFAGNISGAAGAPTTVKNVRINKDGTEPGCNLNVTGDVKVACQGLGGFAGIVTTNCYLQGCEVTKPTVRLEGDMNTATSYVGGAIGNFLGGAGNTSYINGLTVNEPKVEINTVTYKDQCIGAVFGRINTYSDVAGVTVSSPILTYKAAGNPNVALNLGSFAGYIVGNSAQETKVTSITATGNAQLTIGTDAAKATTEIKAVNAGFVGYTTTNVRMEDWDVSNSNVQVYGSLTITSDYFGGLSGRMESGTSAPLILKNVKITGNSNVNVTGDVRIGSYLGGFAGYIGQGSVTNSIISIDDAGVNGTSTVNVGGNVTTASYAGGFVGRLLGKNAAGNSVQADNVKVGTTSLTINGQTTAASYYGGLAGQVTTACTLNDWSTTTGANLTFNNSITALSFVGGAIGSLDGAAGYPSSATGFDIKGVDINFNCNLTNGLYVGGIAGQLNAIAQTNKIEKSSVSGKIRTTGSHTFVRNKTFAIGGALGYTKQSSTTFSEINNCVSEVDFNLSGYTPSDVSGSNYNMQQNGFVIGGVIGRIEAPYRLPESLYYSGKIYAPFAMVGPIVGVFFQKIDAATYAYNDYSAENLNAAVVPELDIKEQNWYFNGYQIGLSSAVSSQALNTTASPTMVDGVNYLTIGESTLTNFNSISGATKHSKTILAYTASGAGGINPAWNTNSATYPAYYMYYMQGVNRGVFVADDEAEAIKAQVLSGAFALLTLTDANADLTQAANRGFISHALTATASGADSYKWYVDGVVQAETSKNFAVTASMKGNTIAVEAIKGGKALKRVEYKVYPVFRVKNISNATEEYGTKTNPYLIGSAEELQFMSYLSTLPLNTTWEKTYTSDNHYNKAYYELDNDIDLSGVADFTPISFATGFVANGAISLGYVFGGVFDGKQHKISGMKEEWYGGAINGKDSYLGWGLFSVVGNPVATTKVGDSQASPAAIRNLIIDGATLTHRTSNTTFNYNEINAVDKFNNVGIGVLAGVVLNNTNIDNIEIRNSKITDEGSSDYSLATGGLYVGGAVGSIQNSFNEQANAPVNTKIQHVAAQVDITLEHPTFADATKEAQLGLFNIGGIIGRYCATSALQDQAQASMPAYTLYSGSVTASKAWISPVLGAARFTGQNDVSKFANYSKVWEGNNNSDVTQLTIANAQYYNFRINEELITELYPIVECGRARSIYSHIDGTDAIGTYNAEKYQGVNYYARFIDSEGTTLRYMNDNVNDGVYWIWDNGFAHMTDQPYKGAYLDRGKDGFVANMENGTASSYRWVISTDGKQWQPVDNVSSQIYSPDRTTVPTLIVAIISEGGTEYRTQAELINIVVFVDGAKGTDNLAGSRIRGWTPKTPVKTVDHANSLLDGGSWDRNIIVVMGTLNNDADFRSTGPNPATLTGRWDGTDYEGVIKIKQINAGSNENAVNPVNQPGKKGSNCYVKADTKFEYLTFQANSQTDGNNFIECHGNDVWFGKGLSMTGFRNLGEDHGNLEMAQNIPELSIILTATNLSEEDIKKYTNRTKPQVVTFESGRYGRILGGRYTGGFFNSVDNTSHAILGSHDHPIWAVVNVNIDKENPNKGAVNRHEEPNKGIVTDNFTCDINCIVAGLTDGSMYGDYTINVHGGKIGYIVGGNQGNPVPNGSKTFIQPGGKSGNWGQWPNATYLGRTVINVEQDTALADIEIDNLYAGGLGRKANGDAATSIVDMYMYGHTEINMKSGTILGNIYGGGAGGVIGLCPWDMHVPYATTDADDATNAIMNGVQYGEWGAKKAGSPLANVTLHDPDGNGGYTTKQLTLDKSYTTLNISGGTINGSVFGGGCGYVSNMPKEVSIQGVGSVFGTSNVNISGGTIHESVYGGSEGSDKYYGATNKYGQKITHIAEMNGTVNLKVTGSEKQYPTIGGNIYGAGMGIESSATEEYPRIATAGNIELGGDNPDKYKTTINVLIDLPESHPFTGNIYGGGEMGAVDGTTNVTIKGGVFEKEIFGAGKGEDGHINKAKVTGTSGVTVDGGNVSATIYGGGALAIVDGDTDVNLNGGDISQDVFGGGMGELNDDHTAKTSADVTGTANVTANGTTFTFPKNGIDPLYNHNIYGGGNLASIVGATNVTINKGLLPAGFLDGDVTSSWGKWIAAVNTQTDNVVQGSVFGGGYGVNTRVTNTAAVHVNVTDNDAANKAMIDVIGGGYNGCVLSNTDVTVAGAAEIYKVYGGGLGSYGGYVNAPTDKRSHANLTAFTKQQTIGSVGEGKENDGTSVTVHGGKIYDNIFGGGAGLKYDANGVSYLNVAEVFGKSHVTVDAITSWDEDNTYKNKIYGGGALGLVDNEILVDIISGTFSGAEFFAGSLGEKGHLDKAKVTASASIRTSANDSEPVGALQGYFNVYGGCDMAQMVGDTHVELQHGTFSGSIFGAGKGLPSEETSPGVWEEYLDYGKVTGATSIVIDEPSLILGQAEGLDANGNVADVTKAIKIYGGGALGLVDGTINPVTLKSGTLYGEVYGGSLGELGHPNKAKITMAEGNVLGVKSEASTINKDSEGKPAALNGNITIYGGCDMALVDGNTKVDIEHGTFVGQMFGGGKGVASNIVDGIDTYAQHGLVQGETTIIYNNDGSFNGNVYGGGALGSVIPATTPADGYTSEIYLKKGILNGHVFGGGYGESSNIDKAKLVGNTFITTRIMDNPDDVLSGSMNHIYGGGDMAMVDGNTNIDFTRGKFNGEIFGGGHGIEENYATAKGEEQYLDFGKVTGSTNVIIDGGELGEPDDPEQSQDENDARKIHIYGGGALGLVGADINIVVKSGTHYGEVFGGSLGEFGHPEKAKVDGNSLVSTEANANKDPLIGNVKFYGGCNQSQVTRNSRVVINHGTFGGAVFGGGKGVSDFEEYGNIGGDASVLIKGGDTRADIYGGGALGNVAGKTTVDLAGGAVNDVYGGGLGDANTAAIVSGDALVTLNGSTVDV